jgi:hypothetical protein
MKKLTLPVILALIFLISGSISQQSFAKDKDKPYMKEIEKMRLKKKKGIFNLNLDVQIGASIANTTFELNSTDTSAKNLTTTSSKVGPTAGVNFSVDFLGVGFTSGLQYTSKGFQNSNGNNVNLNYFNIPLLFYFDFQVGRVIIDGNLGPYFGILLSQDKSTVYNVKNFDFGLTGDVQGAYMFNDYLGSLLGVKYEYGGLNNLGSNEDIKSIRTSTFFIYTGIKFVL